MTDIYGRLLEHALFPAFEAARGRPTIQLERELARSERASRDELHAIQLGWLQRLLGHAYEHTAYYRKVFDERGLHPDDVRELDDLEMLPLLDRATTVATLDARTTSVEPRWEVEKATSGTTGVQLTVRYNAESRHWRDATRWRGYGWAGYHIGLRALHFWGRPPVHGSWLRRSKVALDHALKRDRYLDCTPRSDAALGAAVAELQKYRPEVIVAYSSGAAALARHIVEYDVRDWDDIPVIVGAERLWPHDRAVIEEALGPAFETYGCREVMLIGAECEAHDGMHTSMETMIVELIVRDGDGDIRRAKPGEVGEVAVTDLHNLACPMIRYLTGDLAIARAPAACTCGRTLDRIGPIDGRVTETLHDGHGDAVAGLAFHVLFAVLDHVAREFQVVQHADGSVVLNIVPTTERLPDRAIDAIHAFAHKYLPDTPFTIDYVPEIPLTGAGKRRVVIVEH